MKNFRKGFTLLEILLVVGIIAILAGITIVAINPSKQLAQVRNTERKSDLKQLNNAITQFYIDHSYYPASTTISTTLKEICNTGSASATTTAVNGDSCDTLINLSELVPTYITAIPTDPTGTSSLLTFIPTAYAASAGTGYKVGISDTKKVLLSAPLAELNVRVVVGDVPTVGCSATGGDIDTTSVPGYTIHTFTNTGSDTFTVTSGSCDVEVLVVAGGGGGGQLAGGGAGGLIYDSSYLVTDISVDVNVGAGGAAGQQGENSVFGTITAIGGGAPDVGGIGGSGGGAASAPCGYGTAGQGNDGACVTDELNNYQGGGGGAGSAGDGYQGGNGLQYSISGTPTYYAGGGSGGYSYGPQTAGGLGGGGTGGTYYSSLPATAGEPNTGGGGGGGWWDRSPHVSGGSGIVIVRYLN